MENQALRILLIADADSIWTKRYIEYVLAPAGYQVVVFPIYTYQGKFQEFYQVHQVTLYKDEHRLPVIRRIPRIRMWVRIFLNARSLKQYGRFDAVHCHYISQRDLALGALVAKRDQAVFLAKSLGSDVLRVSARARKKMKLPLRCAKAIHTSSRQSAEILSKDCGTEIAKKISVLNYGASEYAVIQQVCSQKSKAQCRKEIGISEGHYVISLGSNASTGQQQLEMLLAVKKLPKEVLSQLTLIFVVSYGMNEPAYTEKIYTEAAILPCQVLFVKEFLTAEQYAEYQIATDLFVLGAVTDTFSYTLREYLFAGAAGLKGQWLSYDELTELGIDIPSFADFDSLPAAIMSVMQNRSGVLSEEKRQMLYNTFSWEKLSGKWLDLYNK